MARHVWLVVALATVLTALGFIGSRGLSTDAPSASAQPNCDTFAETGQTLCDRFREFWHQNGGLPIFGYPLTPEFTELSELDGQEYTVQYFERAVFELHPKNNPPNDVQLAHLAGCYFRDRHPAGLPGSPTVVPLVSDVSMELYPPIPIEQLNDFAAYPRMEEVARTTTDGDTLFGVMFDTTDDVSTVTAFYQDIIQRQGWLRIGSNWQSNLSSHYIGDYGGRHAYAFTLDLVIRPSQTSTGKTYVRASIYKSLPLMPNARNVTIKELEGLDTRTKTLTFDTSYIPDEVFAFYRETLKADGWQFTRYATDRSLQFNRPAPSRPTVVSVAITRYCTANPRVTVTYFTH
jgi:hypothetical protein